MNAVIQKVKESVIGLLSSLFPEMMYWRRARKIYHNRTGKKLHYRHPEELNEKLMWLTRYWRDPIKTQCADKYLVREFIKSKGLGHLLIPLYGVFKESNEINFNELPEKFVAKCNHGCGYNLFINDKANTDLDSIKNQLDEWLKEEFHNNYCEIHYRDIPHRIICEEMISEDAPIEYQFWCVNGVPDSILVCRKNHNGTYDSWSYSTEWEHLCD